MNKRQSYLSSEFETRSDEQTGQMILSGYFIKYDVETNIIDNLFEKIDKQAVDNAIKDADIRALFNHDTSIVLGRTSNGTLSLVSDEVGLRGDIVINEDDPQAVSIYARIKRGDVSGCSFGFYITEIETQKRSDGSFLDIIRGMELLEVSPCTFPAYPQTEIEARQQDFKNRKKRQLEYKKNKLKEKYNVK